MLPAAALYGVISHEFQRRVLEDPETIGFLDPQVMLLVVLFIQIFGASVQAIVQHLAQTS